MLQSKLHLVHTETKDLFVPSAKQRLELVFCRDQCTLYSRRPDKQALCYDNGMCFALLALLGRPLRVPTVSGLPNNVQDNEILNRR